MPDKPPARRLGRGLDALLGQRLAPPANTEKPELSAVPQEKESVLRDIPVAEIRANHYQPRKEFDPGELRELQNSIGTMGLLQPITVRQVANEPGYELVAG